MIRTVTLFAATSFLSVALACGGEKLANGKSGCPMAAAQVAQADLHKVQEASGDKVELKVAGMTCAGCASAVQAALLGIEGVEAAYVSATDGTASVAFDGKKTNLDALIAAVGGAGEYTASKAPAAAVN